MNDRCGHQIVIIPILFSAADIQMFYPVEAALTRSKGAWPQLRAWRARVTARPAYRRAEEKGGPALPDG